MGNHKDTVIEFFNACNNHDSDAIAAFYAPNGGHTVTGRLPISGFHTGEQMRELSKGIMDAFPAGMVFEIKEVAEDGDTVFCEVESKGVHVTGAPYHQHYAWVFKFNNGLVMSSKEYFDTQLTLEVLLSQPNPA
jgi:ketosteroid isomerase-like protein